MAPLSALVALLAASSTAHTGATLLGALTADVASGTATVAGLLGLGSGALPAQVALLAAVVAGGVALGGAVGSTVRLIPAWFFVRDCAWKVGIEGIFRHDAPRSGFQPQMQNSTELASVRAP